MGSRYHRGMTAGRIDQLTEAQRACLRLVLTHHNSKEIALIVGVSPSAIDKRIERAIQILGVGTRFEAARRLQDHERGGADRRPARPRPPSVRPRRPCRASITFRTGRRIRTATIRTTRRSLHPLQACKQRSDRAVGVCSPLPRVIRWQRIDGGGAQSVFDRRQDISTARTHGTDRRHVDGGRQHGDDVDDAVTIEPRPERSRTRHRNVGAKGRNFDVERTPPRCRQGSQ